MERYAKNAGAVFSLKYHLVWCPKYRRAVLVKPVDRRLKELLQAKAQELGMTIHTLEVMPDHVHLLVAMNTTLSMGQLMQRVKGGSSRLVSQTLCPGEWFAWQGSYLAFAVSSRDRKKIIAYIDNQKTHHADGTLWPNAEKTHLDPMPTPSLVSTQVETGPEA